MENGCWKMCEISSDIREKSVGYQTHGLLTVISMGNSQCPVGKSVIFSYKVFTNGTIPCEIRGNWPFSTGFPTDSTVGKTYFCRCGDHKITQS